jgi:hypothetical protein
MNVLLEIDTKKFPRVTPRSRCSFCSGYGVLPSATTTAYTPDPICYCVAEQLTDEQLRTGNFIIVPAC